MHEMSIAASLLEMAEEEAARQNCSRVLRIKVIYGALTQIMPEALQMCFETLIAETRHQHAVLELEYLPLRLCCPECGLIFGGEGREALWQPCPQCGQEFGHIVKQGRELLLAQVEARK